MKFKWLISVGLVVCLLMAFALPMCAPAPAPPVEEEKPPVEEEEAPPVVEEEELANSVKAYMCFSPDENEIVSAFIKEKLGVEVKQTFMSDGEIGARLEAEAPNFYVDMCISTGSPRFFRAKKEGWTIPYDSPNWRGESEVWKDPDNNFFVTETSPLICVYNKEMLAEKGYEPPKSWDDLLDSKWKGQIVVPSALTSGNGYKIIIAAMTLYGFNVGKGEEGGWEYLKALDKNIHHYTRSGSAPVGLVGRGEFMLGITYAANILSLIEQGYPIEYTLPKEGVGYDAYAAFILKGTEKLYTCQKVIDLLGTTEFCELVGGFGAYSTKDPTAFNPLFGEAPKYIPNIDLEWACENKDRLIAEWDEHIGRVAQ